MSADVRVLLVFVGILICGLVLFAVWWLDRKQHAATTREISALIDDNRDKLFKRLEADRARVRGVSRK